MFWVGVCVCVHPGAGGFEDAAFLGVWMSMEGKAHPSHISKWLGEETQRDTERHTHSEFYIYILSSPAADEEGGGEGGEVRDGARLPVEAPQDPPCV